MTMPVPVAVVEHGPAIEVEALVKVYPGGTRAVDGIDVTIERGEFFAFLGPNGAGKTTTIRILTTLLRPTSGRARVLGIDVVAAIDVRRRIGFAMQSSPSDLARSREPGADRPAMHSARRTAHRVDRLGLMSLNNVPASCRTYSGGMRRRLDLASALVHRPDVLFLDEPTEGLDPQSRSALWDELLRINREGTTMLLTTHYMEESDRLCGRLSIIDEGRIAISGDPAALKHGLGDDAVRLQLAPTPGGLTAAQDAVARRLEGFSRASLERTDDGVRLA
jgi:ABC-type multidrug transport system ATPase subunit